MTEHRWSNISISFAWKSQAELDDLGLEDAFGADRITFVEWAERAPSLLPADRIALEIIGSGSGPRTIVVRA